MTLACPTAQHLLARRTVPQPAPLDFVVVGLNHQTAPVEVRERVAVRPEEEGALLGHLARHADEVLLLATCNRTEVYLAGVHGDPLAAFEGAWGHALLDHLYVYRGEAAVRHLYRVTAGLDSLVIGETQIQGQVKRAWQSARERGLSGTLMNKVVQGALAAGKRVRSHTGLSDKVVSVSSAAVELAQAALGELSQRRALILGAGETAELTLTHLRAAGVQDVLVVNRTAERARALAEKLGGRACPAEELSAALPEVDVVIASSAAPHYVVTAQNVREALAGRPGRAMFLIDISVPRILDPEIASVPGAHLYNLDDLTAVVQRNMQSRRAALPQAEAIIRELGSDLSRWYLTRETQLARQAELALACD
ncbi:glutamyl-tRNA reductase [Deinococcus radiodurans]|jgi:glutamyl-tRNA reductase (EC 1.2.1.70)|uniref:glutamyl-tRNA reductase n=1 Tax=Deinococcus radiodurans TaxID=1299 RepID=UPI0002F75892|nr:glutamyl-tRNA reductase [Deinococcus radiodurans]ANC70426.1 glutamyl-tRNA reductase [Deinococcus radiodurans R1 = ATCC 13939 = DSM 20539]QIP28187.1 glutamyl-tRNA reductase [Deinococcus radiodurans]QIP30934.1 glutamyl-tRNA reductase [Deinococcus radiodurans]UID71501.1 glutamyl-tRNA reductase [Deinococcus radiodurans R1 = ATCC 13939 = DSM 20539]